MQQIAEDIRRPRYFNPYEAIEYNLIDKVLEPEEAALKQIAREQLGLS
jgi:ATP-dependent Clp protease protease subunit